MIRINALLKDVLKDYLSITLPHIFIDLAYASNISIGPLVYKNETACLGCFIGRITKNWGDAIPPNEPEILGSYELISAFILEKIKEYTIYNNCPDLLNNVWNFNVKTFNSSYDRILKLPWCPICGDNKENIEIDLPWRNEVNYAKK